MEIFIRTPSGRTITLDVESSDSIEHVKAQYFDKEGNPPDEQLLIFDGKELKNGRTLADYHVQNQSVIRFVRRIKSSMQIFVKALTGKTIALDVDQSESIEIVKFKIEDREGISFDDQRIIFAGVDWENYRTLAECNIVEGSIINLI